MYYTGNKRKDISLWIEGFTTVYNNLVSTLPSGVTFITTSMRISGPHKGDLKCWVVKLPRFLGIKPHEKYFFPITHGGKDKALESAIQYRNDTLAEYLDNFLSQSQTNTRLRYILSVNTMVLDGYKSMISFPKAWVNHNGIVEVRSLLILQTIASCSNAKLLNIANI